MPVTYRILKDLNLVESVWSGDVTLEESMGHLDALRSDPAFEASMKQLSDAREATSVVSGDGVRGLAKRTAFGPGSRRAILVADDDTFAVARMYEAQVDAPGALHIFRERDEALAWLGIEADELPED